MKPTTIQNLSRLKELNGCITDGSTTVAMLFKQSREDVLKALPEVILLGRALCEAKSILGARFYEWLREEIPE